MEENQQKSKNEVALAKDLSDKINDKVSKEFVSKTGIKLPYKYYVLSYDDENFEKVTTSRLDGKNNKYQTDILIYEKGEGRIIPRIVIETKYKECTTHDMLTYADKAKAHKLVHPYLRYGIAILKSKDKSFPLKMVNHSEGFDFMLLIDDFNDEKISKIMEKIIMPEINQSKIIEKSCTTSAQSFKEDCDFGWWIRNVKQFNEEKKINLLK